ncbi:hypothetical protein EVAR_33464_1 [Eumeta japonica]|uniref:Uncharacterized protein n=1 Tax=Eumeta variegata TaxID=151549 RepID=A0A4C1WFV6_EUMVA|nr:hypothetical protein EVAR_33464_1 [Eumeta japonica]
MIEGTNSIKTSNGGIQIEAPKTVTPTTQTAIGRKPSSGPLRVGSSANRSANSGNTTQCWIVKTGARIAATRPSVGSSANRSANRRQHDPVLDRQQTGARIGGNTTQCWIVSKQERE